MTNNRFDLRGAVPPVTLNLLIINLLMWLAQQVLPDRLGIDLTGMLGLHYFQAESFMPHQLVTYMFLHSTDSLQHLFFNMFSVWMFGSTIERYWGSTRYLFFYLTTGVTAALVQEVVWYLSLGELVAHAGELAHVNTSMGYVPMLVSQYLDMFITIGASGAVFGLLLAFGMLFPNSELFLMFIPIPIKAKYFVIGYGLIELFLGMRPDLGGGVAHFAHLGGMLGGIILILMWRRKGEIDGPYN